MERVNKKSLLKKLSFYLKQNGELRKKSEFDFLEFLEIVPNQKFYYFYWGRGKSRYSVPAETINTSCLKYFCNFKKDNDAPRGGQEGNYITITTQEYKFLVKRLSYFISKDKIIKKLEFITKKENKKNKIIETLINNLKKD